MSDSADPLLKDLTEKKLNFKRNIGLLASELKDARMRLTVQEEKFTREVLTRKVVEGRARSMEEEIGQLKRCLEERDVQLQSSNSASELYLQELDELRIQLSSAQAAAEASAVSAQSAESKCALLLKELDDKNSSLKEHEIRVNKLAEQLNLLQMDLQEREISQRQLKDEVVRIEKDIMHAVTTTNNKGLEAWKFLDDITPKNIANIHKHLSSKDEEIVRLRDEIRFLSAHWRHETADLEGQLEKHRRADQELRKRVAKLEFCLQDARSQTRKLHRMAEKREKSLKEIKDQLAVKKGTHKGKNFWESSGFKVIVSMSMILIVAISKR